MCRVRLKLHTNWHKNVSKESGFRERKKEAIISNVIERQIRAHGVDWLFSLIFKGDEIIELACYWADQWTSSTSPNDQQLCDWDAEHNSWTHVIPLWKRVRAHAMNVIGLN